MRRLGYNIRIMAAWIFVVMTILAFSAERTNAQSDVFQFGLTLGGSGSERIYSVVRAPSGEFYVGGVTTSSDLPVTGNSLDQSSAGGDGFVARFSAKGSLEWLTYLGGNGPDAVYDLALGDGALYAVGATSSTDFPGARPVNGESDAFAVSISLDGSAMYYATMLGGSDQESAYAVAVENGQAVVTGISYSTDFSPSINYGAGDAFVTRLDAGGNPIFIQLFGGRGVDAGFDAALQDGDIWIAGQTFSFNFPARGLKGMQDGFVMRLNSNGGMQWATLVGGAGEDNVQGLSLDQNGSAYITGLTTSSDFPPGDQLYGVSDTYVAQISTDGSISQSVRVGGTGEELGRTLAMDAGGRLVLCGYTTSSDFPVTSGAPQTRFGGAEDAFIASFNTAVLASPDQFSATYFGGPGREVCNGLAAAGDGIVLFSGATDSGAPEGFTNIGPNQGEVGFVGSIAVLPPGAAPLPTATLPQASPTAVVVLTPTIPLVYTPPPVTPSPTSVSPQTTPTGRGEATQQQTPVMGTTADDTLTASTEILEATKLTMETEQTGSTEEKSASSAGWWIGGIAVILGLAGGGWYLFRKNKR